MGHIIHRVRSYRAVLPARAVIGRGFSPKNFSLFRLRPAQLSGTLSSYSVYAVRTYLAGNTPNNNFVDSFCSFFLTLHPYGLIRCLWTTTLLNCWFIWPLFFTRHVFIQIWVEPLILLKSKNGSNVSFFSLRDDFSLTCDLQASL